MIYSIIPSKYRKDIRSNRNLSVDLKIIRELGSKRNLSLSTLFSFGLIYMEIYAWKGNRGCYQKPGNKSIGRENKLVITNFSFLGLIKSTHVL